MIKNVIKNKFFILFVGFVALSVTARFSPSYTLNGRLIALAIGIERNNEEYVVTLEAIKPGKDNAEYQTVKGNGLTVASALSSIEKESGKKVSLAQCEIIFLSKELIEKNKIDFMDNEYFKDMPELAVNVVIDKPGEIVGQKLSEVGVNSFSLGSSIRENRENIVMLEVNMKDLGREYLSYLGAVTLPVIDLIENDGKLKVDFNKGYCFNHDSDISLDQSEYLAYLLLNSNNQTGNVEIRLDENTYANVMLNGIDKKKSIKFVDNGYLVEYELNISFLSNESFLLHIDDNVENKKPFDEKAQDLVEAKLKESVSALVDKSKKKGLDILHLNETFYRNYTEIMSKEKNFASKLDINAEFSFSVNNIK